MKVKWSKLIKSLTIWLASEILLNSLGVDSLADYSEFFYERYTVINVNYV